MVNVGWRAALPCALWLLAAAPQHAIAQGSARAVAAASIDVPRLRMLSGAGGLPIAAMEWGNPDGPPILFLHGFSFAKEFWRMQNAPELAARFHMVAIDLRGHGASGKPWQAADYQDSRLWADDVAATLQAFRMTKPVIVGWSFGGFVAMDFLRHYGNDSAAGVMLVSSPAGLVDSLHPDTPGYAEAALQQMSIDMSENVRGERFFVRLMTARPLPPAVEDEWVIQTLRMPVYARTAMRGRPLANTDLLPTLALPIMMVVGAADRSMPVESMRRLAKDHANITFQSLDGVGHALAYEAPLRFNQVLRTFVAQATSRP